MLKYVYFGGQKLNAVAVQLSFTSQGFFWLKMQKSSFSEKKKVLSAVLIDLKTRSSRLEKTPNFCNFAYSRLFKHFFLKITSN